MTASYLSAALGELAAAVEDFLRWPGVDSRAVFVEEPGEFRWRFTACGEGRVLVKVIEFPDWGKSNDGAGKVIFEAECQRGTLGRTMAAELRWLLDAYGDLGYRQKRVNHDFPIARLSAIEELLRREGV